VVRNPGSGRKPSRDSDVSSISRAWSIAAAVVDPELPVLTLADLGVLRSVDQDSDGRITVTITPTYSGCPAIAAMRMDLYSALVESGFTDPAIDIALSPAWSSDWITDNGRRKLAQSGIAPPSRAQTCSDGPMALTLGVPARLVACPRCGSTDTELTSEFGPTACKALYRCATCAEPFERVKEI
jgi:ring-1,2-phenylacetyl-CoA epoxidase subunit PaaD